MNMDKTYKVIKPYTSYDFGKPILLPAGTLLHWWDERGFYNSEAINGVCVAVTKWAVEAWHEYFEPVA